MMDWLLSVIGLIILLLAGDALVKGAVNLSLRLGIPALIVSLTIVAFGTSAPELLIAIRATLENVPGIALGNVVGSNTANVLLVLGVPAMISALDTSNCNSLKSYGFMILASGVFIALAFTGEFGIWQGSVLLILLAYCLSDAFIQARRFQRETGQEPTEPEDLEGADQSLSGVWIALYLGFGLVGLPLGAELLVNGATSIARSYQVSETAIGLTLIAIGTSLPELAASIAAARKGEHDIAIGNVIGSNMFNLLAVVGIAGAISPLRPDPALLSRDWPVMMGLTVMLFAMAWGWRQRVGKIARPEAALLLLTYFGYMGYLGWSVIAAA